MLRKAIVLFFVLLLSATVFFGCNPVVADSGTAKIFETDIDLTDNEAVGAAFLYGSFVAPFQYTWENAGQLNPDDLVDFCSRKNYLDQPRDFEGTYENPNQPAALVEAAIMERFDVKADYLKTSSRYDPETGTYVLWAGGGGTIAQVMGVKRIGNEIIVEVCMIWPVSDEVLTPDSMWVNNFSYLNSFLLYGGYGVLKPQGTLTLELVGDNEFKYKSFLLYAMKDDYSLEEHLGW